MTSIIIFKEDKASFGDVKSVLWSSIKRGRKNSLPPTHYVSLLCSHFATPRLCIQRSWSYHNWKPSELFSLYSNVVTSIKVLEATTNQEKSNSDTHSLLLCANPRLTSPCTMILWDDLECMELPLEWDNIVTSVAPRGNGQHCILYRCVCLSLFTKRKKNSLKGGLYYRDYGCNGPSLEITRYTPELSNFENQVSSFRCFADFWTFLDVMIEWYNNGWMC